MRKVRCFISLNLERKLNALIDNKLVISNISRNGNEISFVVSYSDLKIVKDFLKDDKSFYYENIGFESILSFFKYRICCFIGIFIFLLLTTFFSCTLLNYRIEGNKTLDSNQIIDILQENGYNIFSFTSKLNSSTVPHLLMSTFPEITFVSCIIKGNTLYVTLQENEDNEQENFIPIYAKTSGIVTSVNVEQGTLAVKKGDVVKKGDILVYPYEYITGEKQFVVPKATIKGKCYLQGKVEYNTNEKILERTGNVYVEKQINFLGINIKIKNDETYAFIKNGNYDMVKNEDIIDFIVPYKKTELLYYELKPLGEPNYEENKLELERKSKYLAYEQVTEDFELESEQLYTEQINGVYYITTYLVVIKSLI